MPSTIFFTAFDFWPRKGGVATCGFELAKTLSSSHRVVVLSSRSFSSPQYKTALPFRLIALPMPKAALFALPILWIGQIYCLLRFRPQILIQMLWMPDGLVSLFNSWLIRSLKCKTILFAHGVELLESQVTLRKRIRSKLAPLKRSCFCAADEVFAVSQYTKQLIAKECHRKNATVVPNGVDSLHFKPSPPSSELRKIYNLRSNFIFLTLTRLDDYKGVDTALHAIAKLKDDSVAFQYLVGGVGSDLPRLKTLVANLNIEDKVVFAGKIPEESLVDFYNLANVFVLLSREDYITPNVEGFGIAFIEAAACAVPSIAGRSGGITDAVFHEETGWLVAPTDVDAVAAQMRFCLNNQQKCKELGSMARAKAESFFRWQNMANKIIKVSR